MKIVLIALTAALTLSLAGVSAVSAATASSARSATVGTARTGLGRVIVDARGHTLYLFEKDKRGQSACSGTCAAYWPPLLAHGKPVAIGGAKGSLLGTIRRSDGSRQVTFAGHPLYLFAGDGKRGDTNGEGLQDFGAGWYALSPSGKKIERDS